MPSGNELTLFAVFIGDFCSEGRSEMAFISPVGTIFSIWEAWPASVATYCEPEKVPRFSLVQRSVISHFSPAGIPRDERSSGRERLSVAVGSEVKTRNSMVTPLLIFFLTPSS